MWNKIKLIFSSNWLCRAISSTLSGLTSSIVVLRYVIEQLKGSAIGEKVIPMLTKVCDYAKTAEGVLITISTSICGVAATAATRATSIEKALDGLDQSTKDLKKL
jgi:hypothetical protein